MTKDEMIKRIRGATPEWSATIGDDDEIDIHKTDPPAKADVAIGDVDGMPEGSVRGLGQEPSGCAETCAEDGTPAKGVEATWAWHQ
jgi:hypothetical protein